MSWQDLFSGTLIFVINPTWLGSSPSSGSGIDSAGKGNVSRSVGSSKRTCAVQRTVQFLFKTSNLKNKINVPSWLTSSQSSSQQQSQKLGNLPAHDEPRRYEISCYIQSSISPSFKEDSKMSVTSPEPKINTCTLHCFSKLDIFVPSTSNNATLIVFLMTLMAFFLTWNHNSSMYTCCNFSQPRPLTSRCQAQWVIGHAPCDARLETGPALHRMCDLNYIRHHLATQHVTCLDGLLDCPCREQAIAQGSVVEGCLPPVMIHSVISNSTTVQKVLGKKNKPWTWYGLESPTARRSPGYPQGNANCSPTQFGKV